jgi:hypothetical protein
VGVDFFQALDLVMPDFQLFSCEYHVLVRGIGHSSVFPILQSCGRRIKIAALTLLLVVSKNFLFNFCSIIELGPGGRAEVLLCDGILKISLLTAL